MYILLHCNDSARIFIFRAAIIIFYARIYFLHFPGAVGTRLLWAITGDTAAAAATHFARRPRLEALAPQARDLFKLSSLPAATHRTLAFRGGGAVEYF